MQVNKKDRYCVMGNPISHSKSPQIHSLFAEQTDQSMEYHAELVEIDGFVKAVSAFQAAGGKGLNITVPFKQQAWELAQQRSHRAQLAGAANTLWFDDQGRLCADNTDGVGLVRDLEDNHQCLIEGRRVLILGAGGAVRGVLEPMLAAKPECLVIANRTVSKADALVEIFSGSGSLQACGFEGLEGRQFDLVINGTAASLQGDLPPLPEDLPGLGAWCYDMMYSAQATPFQIWGREHGAQQSLDGLGMLVEQAAESFFIWRQTRPRTDAVIASIRQAITTD